MKTEITITITSDATPIITVNSDKVSTSVKKEVKSKRVKLTDEQKKEKQKEYARTYFQNNKQVIYDRIRSYQATYHRERRHNDPIFAFGHKQRVQLNTMLNAKGNVFHTEVGCTPQMLREYIESLFTSEMGWHNKGYVWELDHIIPLSSVIEETKDKITHYTNVRPLPVKENRRKHSKLI